MTAASSALTITPAPKSSGVVPPCCVHGCPRSPSRTALIAGWPAGRLCRAHAAEWQTAWGRATRSTEASA